MYTLVLVRKVVYRSRSVFQAFMQHFSTLLAIVILVREEASLTEHLESFWQCFRLGETTLTAPVYEERQLGSLGKHLCIVKYMSALIRFTGFLCFDQT